MMVQHRFCSYVTRYKTILIYVLTTPVAMEAQQLHWNFTFYCSMMYNVTCILQVNPMPSASTDVVDSGDHMQPSFVMTWGHHR